VIEFECLGCGATFEVSESLAGKVIKCRECHQPGKVRQQSASGSGAKIRANDPAAGPLPTPNKWEYHCPCCSTRVLWDWKSYWTPTSTVALILGATINVYVFWWAWWSYRTALSGAVPTAERAGADSGTGLFGIFLMLGITAAVDVLSFRLLWEWRQECPRCGVRVG
jgi:DNA-directed RNA polymerase subunit RPC12/RpoP